MKDLSLIPRILTIILVALALVIIWGTVYGILSHTRSMTAPPQPVPVEDGKAHNATKFPAHHFTGIGRVRISTADPQPALVMLYLTFVYNPEDKSFSEELAAKIQAFRTIITDYIGSFSANDLKNEDEEHIKSELLKRFNAILLLGRIESLYFSDFMIID